MVTINHDWDETNVGEQLEAAFNKYRMACYGDAMLQPDQMREVRQAFLSGILWLSTEDSYCPDEIERALRELIGMSPKGGQ